MSGEALTASCCNVSLCCSRHGVSSPCCCVQVALAKASGKPGAAIDLLRRHVDVYMTDRESWEELAELYVQVGCGGHLTTMCWQDLGQSSDSSAALHCCRQLAGRMLCIWLAALPALHLQVASLTPAGSCLTYAVFRCSLGNQLWH